MTDSQIIALMASNIFSQGGRRIPEAVNYARQILHATFPYQSIPEPKPPPTKSDDAPAVRLRHCIPQPLDEPLSSIVDLIRAETRLSKHEAILLAKEILQSLDPTPYANPKPTPPS